MRALVVASSLAALAAPALADTATPPASPIVETSEMRVQPAGKQFKKLQIENALGNVRIVGHDGKSIRIETVKHAPDDETLDRLRVSLVPDADGGVRIMTAADTSREAKAQPKQSVSIDLVIHAPRDARIDATVGSGKLEVFDMDGGGELDTASGAILVRNVSGELYTHSVSGHMQLTQVFGSLDAATVSSDLELDTINGQKLVASADQGRIAGRRVRARDVEITTTSGNIVLEGETSMKGRIIVSSLRGDVDVKLRRRGGVVIRGRGTKIDIGSLAKAQPSGWMELRMGVLQDPALVELRSHLGSVRFTIIQ
jgi:DUF4097 and DUF4098 domain-containing protein YvlB